MSKSMWKAFTYMISNQVNLFISKESHNWFQERKWSRRLTFGFLARERMCIYCLSNGTELHKSQSRLPSISLWQPVRKYIKYWLEAPGQTTASFLSRHHLKSLSLSFLSITKEIQSVSLSRMAAEIQHYWPICNLKWSMRSFLALSACY